MTGVSQVRRGFWKELDSDPLLNPGLRLGEDGSVARALPAVACNPHQMWEVPRNAGIDEALPRAIPFTGDSAPVTAPQRFKLPANRSPIRLAWHNPQSLSAIPPS